MIDTTDNESLFITTTIQNYISFNSRLKFAIFSVTRTHTTPNIKNELLINVEYSYTIHKELITIASHLITNRQYSLK